MNTSSLKRFAQQARTILKNGVEKQLIQWGYNPQNNQFEVEPLVVGGGAMFGAKIIEDTTFVPKWNALRQAVKAKGMEQVVEQAAYTWFNRLMAIRILSQNDYIPAQLEYTSRESRITAIVQAAKQGVTPALNKNQQNLYQTLVEDDTQEIALFRLLITAYCQENKLLNRVFGKIDDFSELLLPDDILAPAGFVELLNTTDAISDTDYQQVELIGWLYQFYISEKKDEVFKSFKNKKKAEAEDIPAATQIFTPNWIVKYMVENTVGRLWLDLHPDSPQRTAMRYLVENPDAKAEPIIAEVAEIKLLDPACGSGHILVEGFDRLFAMYREEFYTAREAVDAIFKHNLFGLDIDLRAAQLSQFALLLKAAQQDRTVIERNITPQVYAMPDTAIFTEQEVADFLGRAGKNHIEDLSQALQLMRQSQNLGSIMKLTLSEEARSAIVSRYEFWLQSKTADLREQELWQRIRPYMDVLLVLTQKYEAVVANPPYMGSGNMNEELKEYLNDNYPEGKADLMTAFMMVAMNSLTLDNGYWAMIDLPSWMFLSTFEKLRKDIISTQQIVGLLQLGRGIFGSDFGSVAFVMQNRQPYSKGEYRRLFTEHVQVRSVETIHQLFLDKNIGRFLTDQKNFEKIPGSPLAYWVSEKLMKAFENKLLPSYAFVIKGLSTGDVSRFLRLWQEVAFRNIGIGYSNREDAQSSLHKWFPYYKGGEFRRWYGNIEFVVNWENDGYEVKGFVDEKGKQRSRPQNLAYYFKKAITYSALTSYKYSTRFMTNAIFGGGGDAICCKNDLHFEYIFALLNSVISENYLKIISPTLNYEVGHILSIPIIYHSEYTDVIKQITINSTSISRQDWDAHETSWDFQENELILAGRRSIAEAYHSYLRKWEDHFAQLHANEVELNRIFIDIYGLQDELTPEVKLKDITILQEELDTNAFGDATELKGELPIKPPVLMSQLISYAIGCLMGRYRLDKPGLHTAHPNPTDEEIAPYEYNGHTFEIDEDGIIPLMDSDVSFADNALNRIKRFFELVWGEENLVDTLNFVEAQLGKDLETYLVKDFWREHCRRYQKRPIYWLFASPKGAFQVMAYMHRMNRFTVEKIRSQYLLRHIRNLENRISTLQMEESQLNADQHRTFEKLQKDLAECREYDLKLKDMADAQIEFDLDDGVVVNYAKFGEVVAVIK
jgi:hypothetical protein